VDFSEEEPSYRYPYIYIGEEKVLGFYDEKLAGKLQRKFIKEIAKYFKKINKNS
jgi:hypothetical protein